MSHTPRTPRAVDQRRALGRRIRAYRLALGLTTRDIALHIGSSTYQVTSMETVCRDVLLGTAIDVAAAVGLDVALVADYHLPLLQLTADEIAALADLSRRLTADAGWISPVLRSALNKLTTTEEACRG